MGRKMYSIACNAIIKMAKSEASIDKSNKKPLAWQNEDVDFTGPLAKATTAKTKYQIALKVSLAIKNKTNRCLKALLIRTNHRKAMKAATKLTQAHDRPATNIARLCAGVNAPADGEIFELRPTYRSSSVDAARS